MRRGTDIRDAGSGNAGARNIARVFGRADAALTLAIDVGKGAVAVWLGTRLVGHHWAGAAAMAAVIAGHIWPAQLSFRGGKGAATGLGAMLVLDPLATVALAGVGLALLLVTRRFTTSGLAAIALAAPGLAVFGHPWPTLALAALGSVLVLAAHHPSFRAARRPRFKESDS